MRRFYTQLRSLATQSLHQSSSRRLIHHSALTIQSSSTTTTNWSSPFIRWPLTTDVVSSLNLRSPSLSSHHLPLSLVQVRHAVTSRDRKSKRKRMTPLTSKVKKIKLKSYSSYKSRFRTMKDGQIRRWREGKLHNAHLKDKNMFPCGISSLSLALTLSKKSKRRLRQPAVVPAAYAKQKSGIPRAIHSFYCKGLMVNFLNLWDSCVRVMINNFGCVKVMMLANFMGASFTILIKGK
ncbi:hypothetical protein ACFE04_012035 [Oxalis oulophora]